MLFTIALASGMTITDFKLISESGQNYLSFELSPTISLEQIIITPDDAATLSGNLFTLSKNLTIETNASEIRLLYEIDRQANESVYSAYLNVWCGASFSDCGNCGGMQPGTYKYCNGAYPTYTYYCDNWCYTYSPAPTHEKAQVGQFIGFQASAQIALPDISPFIYQLNHIKTNQSDPNLTIQLLYPPISIPPQNIPLIRSYSDQKWRAISQNQYSNYKSSLAQYNGLYLSSHANANSQTPLLNGALSSLISASSGEYVDYFDQLLATPTYPKLAIKIPSESAGVSALRGKPNALSLALLVQFDSLAPYFSIEFQNIGPAADNFNANLTCDNFSISLANPVILEPNQIISEKFFVPQFSTPQLCTATVFLEELPAISNSIIATLAPFKLSCPAENQCCTNSESYEDKPCIPTEKFHSNDAYGNGYFYMQYYSCENYSCLENSTNVTRIISGNAAPIAITPNQQSYFASTSNYNPPDNDEKKPTAIPSEAQKPKISPSPTSIPSPTMPPKIPISQDVIEIFAPQTTTPGYETISVFANSKPASGTLEIISPASKKVGFVIESGSAEVLFNELGIWKASFEGEVKTIVVEPEIISLPKQEKQTPSEATSLISLDATKLPFLEIISIIIFLSFGYVGFKRQSERIHFSKSFENNIVRLEIINGKADLKNLEITDIVPEGNVLSTISNPPSEVTEIIFGKHIKWKKNNLQKGERMLISYSIFSQSKGDCLKPAELLAEIEGNKRILVLSNAISA